MQNSDFAREKPRKSVRLTPEERKALRLMVKVNRKEYAALAIGITRTTLDRILLMGTAKQETLDKIRKAIATKSDA